MNPTDADREYDRDGAWERLLDEINRDATTAYADPKAMFFAELDAAAAFARRECIDRIREIAHVERIPTHLTPRQVINLVADHLALLPPAPTKESP
jgi:hypothetical protein